MSTREDANGGVTKADGSATASVEGEESVQPSTQLINILHRRLRDPSIVSSFERRHSNQLAEGVLLARPHWILRTAPAAGVEGGDGNELDQPKTSPGEGTPSDAHTQNGPYNMDAATSSSSSSLINSIPKRNYIDLRIQQNEMFANHQSTKCSTLLSNLKKIQPEQQSTKKQHQQQKIAHDLQSLLNEGLAACPNHEGLLSVQKEYKDWIIGQNGARTNSSNHVLPVAASASLGGQRGRVGTTTSDAKLTSGSSAILSNPQMLQQHQHKGAEGRAQAAMRDALAERSFLLGDDGKKKDDSGEKYPLLSAADVEIDLEKVAEEVAKDNGPDYDSSSDDSDSRSRSRRRRKKKKSKHKYKRQEKRHRRDYDRKRRKDDRHRRRSRSRSVDSSGSRRSISSHSTSSSMTSADSYKRSSKRKRYRKKDHKRRKKKKKHHHKRAKEHEREEDTKGNVSNENDNVEEKD